MDGAFCPLEIPMKILLASLLVLSPMTTVLASDHPVRGHGHVSVSLGIAPHPVVYVEDWAPAPVPGWSARRHQVSYSHGREVHEHADHHEGEAWSYGPSYSHHGEGHHEREWDHDRPDHHGRGHDRHN